MYKASPQNQQPGIDFILPYPLEEMEKHPIFGSPLDPVLRPDYVIRWILHYWLEFDDGRLVPVQQFATDLLESIYCSELTVEEQLEAEAYVQDNIKEIADLLHTVYMTLRPLLQDTPHHVEGFTVDSFEVEPFDNESTLISVELNHANERRGSNPFR